MYDKKYYQEHKLEIREYNKKYYKKNKEKLQKRSRDYYLKDKEKWLRRSKEYNKKTNYAYQKKPERRKLLSIKRRTRELYPLKDKECIYCNGKAEEHHHNTIPIKAESFEFVCKKCHKKIHDKLKEEDNKNDNKKNC